MDRATLGPAQPDYQAEVLLRNKRITYTKLDHDELIATTADRLAAGRIVGWFQGRMEFGPRALGSRSILAHPGVPDMKDRLNAVIKHREAFRPFGASVLETEVPTWFEEPHPSPFMLMVHTIREDKRAEIPAVTHVNHTCRIQTVTPEVDGIYHELITAFQQRTGIPMVLNTSFNDSEPIVNTHQEALDCYTQSGMDCLVLGPYFVERESHDDA
jgi:carbamoyltransferase